MTATAMDRGENRHRTLIDPAFLGEGHEHHHPHPAPLVRAHPAHPPGRVHEPPGPLAQLPGPRRLRLNARDRPVETRRIEPRRAGTAR